MLEVELKLECDSSVIEVLINRLRGKLSSTLLKSYVDSAEETTDGGFTWGIPETRRL